MASVQVDVPVQAPPQPVNIEPAAGVAVSVTPVPLAYASVQSVPHSMPAGALRTVPLPAPARLTVRLTGASPNVAVTVAAAVIVTVQPAVPVQAPLQPVNVEPAAGAAASATTVPPG
jgi:hypothetical protein